MLVFSRRTGDEIVIDDYTRITILSVKGDRVRIGISAPDRIRVDRAEVYVRKIKYAQHTHNEVAEHSDSAPVG